MRYHVLTLFPDMIEQGMNTSITKRAMEKGIIELECINIRDFTMDKHKSVDDYPYGGGAGMLMQPQPVYDAWKSLKCHEKAKTIYVSPKGRTFSQKMAEELSEQEDLIFLCGHYEGIDERVLEKIGVECISIGDYVLTGGELPAMVMMDCISRLVPGVLNNATSSVTESFSGDLLEYPQYTRPEIWKPEIGEEIPVPKVLLGGNHKDVIKWQKAQAEEITRKNRPDMYQTYLEKQKVLKHLLKKKRENACIIDILLTGQGDLLSFEKNCCVAYHRASRALMVFGGEEKDGFRLPDKLPEKISLVCTNREDLLPYFESLLLFQVYESCYQSVYTKPEKFPVEYKNIKPLTEDEYPYVGSTYSEGKAAEYVKNRIEHGEMFGAFDADGNLLGFCGNHKEGSLGMLYVKEEARRKHIGSSLTGYLINMALERGIIPYAHVLTTNEKSLKMQEKMGLYLSKNKIYWLGK